MHILARGRAAALLVLSLTTTAGARPVPNEASRRIERYSDLPPILIPETAGAPVLPRGSPGGEVVLRLVIDTAGRVDLARVETLAAADSGLARAARATLPGIRYIPARTVLDVGRCVRLDGDRMHCGGVRPQVRRLRSRVVLQMQIMPEGPN